MKTALIIIFVIVLALAALICAVSVILAHYVVYPQTISYEDAHATEERKGFLKDYDSLPKQKYDVISFDGYIIHGEYIPAAEDPGKGRFVILTHGYTYDRLGSVKYMHIYRDMGFNCIEYDLRGHGENEKTIVTMGIKEARDLIAIIDKVHTDFGEDIILGLHGESMGSGTEINALQYRPKVDFVVNDCGYGELMSTLVGQLQQRFHMPPFLVSTAAAACRLFYGYSFKDVRPIDALHENNIPILFIHGAEDAFVPCQQSKDMAAATKGESELYLCPGAGHAQSYEKDPETYKERVRAFVTRCIEKT